MALLTVITVTFLLGGTEVYALPNNMPGSNSKELLELPGIPQIPGAPAPSSTPAVTIPTPPPSNAQQITAPSASSVTAPGASGAPSANVTAPLAPSASTTEPSPQPVVTQEHTPADDQHIETSLMFNQTEIDTINQAIKIYDSIGTAVVEEQPAQPQSNQPDLFSDLEQQGLPNLYLGSLVYYSPGNWSIRINGKRVNATDNVSGNRFYVSRISRKEVEILWKPTSLYDTVSRWQQLTDNGQNPPPGVSIDGTQGTIRLLMGPNQTFVINTLTIQEGLIK